MSGKLCNGQPQQNAGAGRISQSRSFCEGIAFRMLGTEVSQPKSANPHYVNGSPDYLAWNRGWDDANGSAGTTLPTDEGKCCAVDYDQLILA